MCFIITFAGADGDKIGVNKDHIIDVRVSNSSRYKCVVTYGVSDTRGGVIHMKESLEEVVNYINSGKWEAIR